MKIEIEPFYLKLKDNKHEVEDFLDRHCRLRRLGICKGQRSVKNCLRCTLGKKLLLQRYFPRQAKHQDTYTIGG